MPSPVTTASAPHDGARRFGRRGSRASRCCDLLAHVGDVEVRDRACAREQAVAASGSSVWTWILSVVAVADDQNRVPKLLEPAMKRRWSRSVPVTAKLVQ